MFQVRLDDGNNVSCFLSGKPRMQYIRIAYGDRVRVEMNPGNASRGRIVWHYSAFSGYHSAIFSSGTSKC